MSLQDYQFKKLKEMSLDEGKPEQKKTKKLLPVRRSSSPPSSDHDLAQQADKCGSMPKKKKKAPKKRKINKEQENQGIRIAKEKKVQYLFKNICNPSGKITIESLGRALAKHKLEFKLPELKQMMAVCIPEQFNEKIFNFEVNQLTDEQRRVSIEYELFREFYLQKF